MSKAACAFALLMIVACAMGGSPQGGDAGSPADAKVYRDAHAVTGDSAVSHADASMALPDAFVPQDAGGGGSGAFCSDNTGCGSGFCCWVALCVPGTPIGTTFCLPN
jgi:hypothetical protein